MTPFRCIARVPCSPFLHMSNGNKASERGRVPHIGDVYCNVPGTLHVGNLTRFRGVQSTPGLIYDMMIIFTRCLQKTYVGRSHITPGNKVRSLMPACGDEPGFEESSMPILCDRGTLAPLFLLLIELHHDHRHPSPYHINQIFSLFRVRSHKTMAWSHFSI